MMNEIEFIESMGTLNIKEGDILVVKIDHVVRADVYNKLKENIEANVPETMKGKIKVFILEPGMDIGIVRKEFE